MKLWLNNPTGWKPISIPQSPLVLHQLLDGSIEPSTDCRRPWIAAAVPFEENGRRRTALITGACSELAVNGLPPFEVTVLSHKDEITIGKYRIYFGAYSVPMARSLDPGHCPTACGRCASPLMAGDLVVQCPACLSWHHQGPLANGGTERRECWSYDPRCGFCGREQIAMTWHPGEDSNESQA